MIFAPYINQQGKLMSYFQIDLIIFIIMMMFNVKVIADFLIIILNQNILIVNAKLMKIMILFM